MTCKDCLKYDVCGKAHRLEHPDENNAENVCKSFLDKWICGPIIRCKYCEFVKDTKCKLNGKPLKNCDLYKRPCYDEDYCSRAVRKDNENDTRD